MVVFLIVLSKRKFPFFTAFSSLQFLVWVLYWEMKEQFIPGIYNYCDRWCERCHFTSRCRNYESTSNLSPEQLDINNEAFWKNLSSNFKVSIELLQKAAKKFGIDLSKPFTEEEDKQYEIRKKLLDTKAKQHPLINLCKQYRTITRPFIENGDEVVNKSKELVKHVHLGIKSGGEVLDTVAGIGDCFDIIQWYLFFIEAKLHRALRGRMDGEDWEAENGFQKDSNGSAKVALLAIERSIEAWAKLFELLPSGEDIILNALSLLTQLKEISMKEFPEAMQFKRPGFDD